MSRMTVVILTLVVYQMLLLGIGWWAKSRNQNEEDFFLGGRGLGPLVAAISYSSSASSAWTLLGVSGIAYVLGVSALWIAAGSFTGMLVAWFWIAPRLMAYSRLHQHITLTDLLSHETGGSMRRAITIVSSVIIIFSFTFYVAAQFQGAGNSFAGTFQLSMTKSILIGAAIIMVYTMLGGFWAVSVTDTVQGLLMALTAIILPIAALAALGGPGGFIEGLQSVSTLEQLSWSGGNAGLVALGVVLGSLSIGFGTYGQPHLLVRFMALRDEKAMRQARVITIAWYLLVFLAMLFLGLAGHVLHGSIENSENIFFVLTENLFSPFVGAVVLAAVLSAIMSTADSQLLVAASAISHDLGFGKGSSRHNLMVSRLTIAGLVLADMGAETIKVEPLCGERTRRWLENDPEFSIDGMSVYFLTLNRNKKSVAIDLKSPDGLEVFYDLVRQCDVVISNFTIGVTQRLKIEYESLQSINPRIISCCISGFGSDGPDNLRPSFDLIAQGTSGMMSVTGTDAEHPVRTGTQMGDIGASLFAATGILAAVHERGRSGIGQHVDISMLDCQISLLNYLVSMYGFSGRNPEPMGNAHSVHVPYNTYAASDGHIVIAVLTDKFWQRFKQVMNSEDLDKPDFDTQSGRNANREFIEEKINEIGGGGGGGGDTAQYWLDKLQKGHIPCSPVNLISQALADPQLLHRNMVVDLRHPGGESRKGPGNPIKMSRSHEERFEAAPVIGQDTDEVLASLLNYGPARIKELRSKGVIG